MYGNSLAKNCSLLPPFLAEYKSRSVCENEELKLHCKESKFLNIYSASYGRSVHEKDICSSEVGHLPQFGKFYIYYFMLINYKWSSFPSIQSILQMFLEMTITKYFK